MGGACGTCGGEEEHRQACGGGIRRKETTLKTWASMGDTVKIYLQDVGW
jgi:hypothetical protein